MEYFTIKYGDKKYLNWPLMLQTGGCVVNIAYHAYNPHHLSCINVKHILAHIGIMVSYGVGVCLIYEITANAKKTKELNETSKATVAEITQNISLWTLPLLTFGEDALFIPSFLCDKIWIKLLTSTAFGLIHYLGGAYSLEISLLKIPATFFLLYYHSHLINFSIGHWFLDFLLFKIAATAYSKKA